ncbi:PL8L1 protein, partial [Amia calva]|nr:PL8L1 protein [Amia calva]
CFSFWCFPCFACKTTRDYGECLCLPILDMFNCIPPVGLSLRVGTRQRYGIHDTVCNDCLYSFFCYSCSWCQIAREMKIRNAPVVLNHALPRATAMGHQS